MGKKGGCQLYFEAKIRKDRSVLLIDWEESVMSNENWKWKAYHDTTRFVSIS